MKIYGQTEDIIVREMTEDDAAKFLEFMADYGTARDYTVDEIKLIWRHRNKLGNTQCTITSTDGNIIYGFGGIFHTPTQASEICIDFFKKHENRDYRRQVKAIMMRLSLEKVFEALHIDDKDKKNGGDF